MGGLLNTGTSYENQALSGFVRRSAEQSQMDSENRKIKAAEKAQKASIRSTLVGSGAAIGLMAGMSAGEGGAAMLGLELGGPAGLLVGAGIGFLASELF